MGTPAEPPVPPGPAEPYSLSDLMPPAQPPAPAAPPPAPVPHHPASSWTALGAGVAAVVASFLPWGSVTVPIAGTVTAYGTDGSDGWVTAVVGGLVAFYAGTTLRRRPPTTAGVLAAMAALGVAGIAIWKIVDLRSRIADLRAEVAAAAEGEDLGFAETFAGAVQARVGAGLWLLVVAGLVAAVAIGYGLLRRA